MNTRTIFSVVALTLFAVCSSATAQTYTLGYDQTRYDVAPGDSVDIVLILTEEITGAEESRLEAGGNDGLFSFSASVDYSMFSGGASGSQFESLVLNDLFTTGFAGSGEDVTQGVNEISFEGTEDFAGNDTDDEAGVGGTMTDPNIFQIELATLTFNAGGEGTITTLQTQRHSDADANPFLFGDGASPTINFANSQIFVSAVPEPSSIAFIAMIAGAGLLKRRRN